jgi:hypothetical protein
MRVFLIQAHLILTTEICVSGVIFVKTGDIPDNKGLYCQDAVTFDMTCALLCVRLKHPGAHMSLVDVVKQIGDGWRTPLPYNYNTIACAAALVSSRTSMSGGRVVKTDHQCDITKPVGR